MTAFERHRIMNVQSGFQPTADEIRLCMAVDSVRFKPVATNMVSFITVNPLHIRTLDSEPARNTRETFAGLALELGLRVESQGNPSAAVRRVG